ncbi:MAG: BMP family ABC transporter substrate-binding protein [Anaerolineales bacterium]|nr:BMP family ABC transporter substrate-binding protein [Anaerolineales bacterium]
MIFHKKVVFAVLLSLTLVLGACAPAASQPDAAAGEDAAAEGLTIGLILVGPRNDHGWSQAHYEGGLFVEEHLPGSQVIVFESLNPADKPEATVASVVADMVEQGAKLIITTSDEFEEDTTTVAASHPEVVFINVSGDDARTGEAPANLGNVMGRMEDMKAIAGCAAALNTQTGHIGYVGPLINHETIRLTASAYLGARHCYETYRGEDPAALKFDVTWIGFWFNIPGVTLDPTEVANNFFDTGVDVIMSGIDTTEAIDVTAQRAAADEAILAVPYDYLNACDSAPAFCLGVPFFSWGPAYLALAESVAAGAWEQSWDWNAANWDALTDPGQTDVGWLDGPALQGQAASDLHDFIAKLAAGEVDLWAGPVNLRDGTVYVAAGQSATDEQIWYLPALLQGMGESQ